MGSFGGLEIEHFGMYTAQTSEAINLFQRVHIEPTLYAQSAEQPKFRIGVSWYTLLRTPRPIILRGMYEACRESARYW
jgi:hypothetical protein